MEKETVGIDYTAEYYRLKDVETENKELKETIISMSKFMFRRDEELIETIKRIEKTLSHKK